MKIILSICAVIFLVAVAIFYFFYWPLNTKKVESFDQEKRNTERMLMHAKDLARIWNEGEESREWVTHKKQCLSDWNVKEKFDETQLRCHPLLIDCLGKFSKNADYKLVQKVEWDNHFYRYTTRSNTAYRGLDRSGIVVQLLDSLSNQTLDVYLKDNCQEVYLEQRTYSYGEYLSNQEAIDYRFDNYNRHLFLDTHLVTNSQINDWISFSDSNSTLGLKKKNGDDLFKPATGLSFSQMQGYCAFVGKQIMQAQWFDAATFLPFDLNVKDAVKNIRSPYYWTKKVSEFKNDCSLFYSKDCLDQSKYQMNSIAPSWAGIKDSMGGVLEAFKNPIEPTMNLKASSFYFDGNSSWHKLGNRAFWSGDGFDLRHFEFRGSNPFVSTDHFQIGFRCMKEEMK